MNASFSYSAATAAQHRRATSAAVCKVQGTEVKLSHPWANGKGAFTGNLVKRAGAGPRKPGALFIVFITFANIRLQTAPPEPR